MVTRKITSKAKLALLLCLMFVVGLLTPMQAYACSDKGKKITWKQAKQHEKEDHKKKLEAEKLKKKLEQEKKDKEKKNLLKQKQYFSGTWNTNWGTMNLTQSGSKVTGTFVYSDGKIEGKATGLSMVGKWSKTPSYNTPTDAGDLILFVSLDKNNLWGAWRIGSSGAWHFDLKGTSVVSTPEPPKPVETPWASTWNTTWGEMKLAQDGKNVSGTYIHASGKISGTLNGRTFTGKWSEAPTYAAPYEAGDVIITISSDGKSLSGKWRYGSSGDWQTNWRGTRYDSGTSTNSNTTTTPTIAAAWTGTWTTSRGQLKLVQNGSVVTGTYNNGTGSVSGTVNGSVLSGSWAEAPGYTAPDHAGNFEFTMNTGGRTFAGKWRGGFTGDWKTGWDGMIE